MATIFCANGGSNTSPYDTWGKAATSLPTALSLAAAGDTVVIQYNAVPSGDAELSADTTYTMTAGSALIAASNDGGSAWTPTAMTTANWIGNSTTNRSVTFDSSGAIYLSGLTIRTAGSTADSIFLGSSDGCAVLGDNLYFYSGNTATTAAINLGSGSATTQAAVRLFNPTFRFGHASQKINIRGAVYIYGGLVAAATIPSVLFVSSISGCGAALDVEGFAAEIGSSTLVGDCPTPLRATFANCISGSGMVALAAQSTSNQSGAEVWLYNVAAGDTHYQFGHYNALGSTIADTGIYADDGATYDGTNHYSWKIVTTANATFYNPYVSPWLDKYNAATSAVTPYFEVLRDGSATAYTDAEVWGEWSYQNTNGYPRAGFVDDRRALNASAANQASGVGTSGWTGEGGSAWSGKLAPASAITPAEIGHYRARVMVGKASATMYVDPLIRGV